MLPKWVHWACNVVDPPLNRQLKWCFHHIAPISGEIGDCCLIGFRTFATSNFEEGLKIQKIRPQTLGVGWSVGPC